ncbi:MAG: hypothetical protein H6696_11160 [Deferribacteres bacterium]|nr:hypothetical protein [candidate division KSB1 bacterium]MCB9502491.1 hypothetical protein [Deferribacteres bacterium]
MLQKILKNWKSYKPFTKLGVIASFATIIACIVAIISLFFRESTPTSPQIPVENNNFILSENKGNIFIFNKFEESTLSLLDSLKSANSVQEKNNESDQKLNGVSIHFIVKFYKKNKHQRKFIYDLGEELSKNRISIYFDSEDYLCFRLIDNQQEPYTLKIPKEKYDRFFQQYQYINCEFGISTDSSYMKILQNGTELSHNSVNYKIDINLKAINFKKYTIGASLNKNFYGKFDLAEFLVFSSTLTNLEKEKMRKYVSKKYGL